MNENYGHPAMPAGAENGILRGMYPLRPGGKGKVRVQLLGSGTILREVIAAADMLQERFGIPADVWSVTSFSELRRDALEIQRWNMLHPEAPPRQSYVESRFRRQAGSVCRRDRLHEARIGSDSAMGTGPVHGARHRRVRPQRWPGGAALVLRGRSQVDRRRRAESAGR